LEGKWEFSRGPFIILELFGGNIVFLQLFAQLNYFIALKSKKHT
jgi:hypothetical protein